MKVLVTGGNGFIGSFLIEQLIERGWQVRVLIRKTSNLQWIHHLPIEYVFGDLLTADALIPAVEGIDIMVHLGGLTKARLEKDYFNVNAIGTQNLLNACLQVNSDLQKFIFISSLAAAGPAAYQQPVSESQPPNPLTPYGRSKAEAEKITLSFQNKLPVTIIRPPAVYGPRDTEVYEIFKYVKMGIKPRIAGPERLISIIHVRDLVAGILLAAQKEIALGKIYFLAGEGYYSWEVITDTIEKALGKKAFRITLPLFVFDLAAFFCEGLAAFTRKAALINRYKVLEMKQLYWTCDFSRAQKELDFQPRVTLQEGIHETVEWYQQAGWL